MSSNNNHNRIGNNIHALRIAHFETQDKLAKAIGTSRNNISNYENKGYCELNIISAIANRYDVSVQEIMCSDLSRYDLHLNIDNLNNAINAIYCLFPIIESEKALSNPVFSIAYNKQKELYDTLLKFDFSIFNEDIDKVNKGLGNEIDNDYYLHLFELYNKYPDYLNNYAEAFKNDEIKIESAVNYIAVYHIISSQMLSVSAILDKTAILSLMVKLMPAMESAMENVSSFSEKEFYHSLPQVFSDFEGIYNNKWYNDLLNVMMSTINEKKEYTDLAEYYVALEFVHNIVDNDFDRATNKRNGYEMLKRIAKLGNVYAKRYIKINPDPTE